MTKLNKLTKVNESITINRYENGWVVELTGRDKKDEWKTIKLVCNTEQEAIDLFKEYNQMELEN